MTLPSELEFKAEDYLKGPTSHPDHYSFAQKLADKSTALLTARFNAWLEKQTVVYCDDPEAFRIRRSKEAGHLYQARLVAIEAIGERQ